MCVTSLNKPSSQEGLKNCNKCGEDKPVSQFYKMRNGLQPFCKACEKLRYSFDRESIRKSDDGRKKLSEYRRTRVITEAKRLREVRHSAKYRARYPEKQAAKQEVTKALKSGRLIRPPVCQGCGLDPGLARDGRPLIQAHHEDYSRPLDVSWLCLSCHSAQHARSLKLPDYRGGEAKTAESEHSPSTLNAETE